MPPNGSRIRRGSPPIGDGLRESFARTETAHRFSVAELFPPTTLPPDFHARAVDYPSCQIDTAKPMLCSILAARDSKRLACRDVVATIRSAVIGLGLLADEHDPLSVVIIGTGFVVHPDGWVMTNRHVAELFIGDLNDSHRRCGMISCLGAKRKTSQKMREKERIRWQMSNPTRALSS
jgi:hypothetical protein